MKRIAVFLAAVLLAALFSGCASLKSYTLGDVLPSALDDATLLSPIDSVHILRVSDGAEITVTGTDVELLMLTFDGIPCMRRKAADTATDYTLTFTMTDKTDVRPPLHIVIGTGEHFPYFLYGGYEYEPVNMRFDLTYIVGLFAD